MGHITRIYQALLNRKEKVCHKLEILGIIQEYKNKFKSKINIINTIKYLSRHQYIKRIFQGYYYLNSIDERKMGYCLKEDKELLFIVLNKLKIRWYIGLSSAMYLTGRLWQVPRVIHILNDRLTGTKKILSLKVSFSKIKRSLFFGLKEGRTTNKVKYFYSNTTKTQLDMIYLKKSKKAILRRTKYLKHYPKWVGKK